MKYRNLDLTFTMGDVLFTVLSISTEQMINPIPRHSHSRNSYEMHYISYGYGTLIADDIKYDIIPGTFFMTGPGVFHEQISDPKDPMREYGIYIKVGLSHNGPKDETIKAFLDQKFFLGPADMEMYELMKKLISELEQGNIGYRLMISAIIQQIVLHISRQYRITENEKITGPGANLPINGEDQTYLIIEEAFLYSYRDITLEKLADMLGLSSRQTERLLIKHYNKTFLQKKKEARMSAASILLKDSSQSIASVAYNLGYSSSEHFTNAFKNFFHMTPSVFRKIN